MSIGGIIILMAIGGALVLVYTHQQQKKERDQAALAQIHALTKSGQVQEALMAIEQARATAGEEASRTLQDWHDQLTVAQKLLESFETEVGQSEDPGQALGAFRAQSRSMIRTAAIWVWLDGRVAQAEAKRKRQLEIAAQEHAARTAQENQRVFASASALSLAGPIKVKLKCKDFLAQHRNASLAEHQPRVGYREYDLMEKEENVLTKRSYGFADEDLVSLSTIVVSTNREECLRRFTRICNLLGPTDNATPLPDEKRRGFNQTRGWRFPSLDLNIRAGFGTADDVHLFFVEVVETRLMLQFAERVKALKEAVPTETRPPFTLDEIVAVLGSPDERGAKALTYSGKLKVGIDGSVAVISYKDDQGGGTLLLAGLLVSKLFTLHESETTIDFIDEDGRSGRSRHIGRFRVTINTPPELLGWKKVTFERW